MTLLAEAGGEQHSERIYVLQKEGMAVLLITVAPEVPAAVEAVRVVQIILEVMEGMVERMVAAAVAVLPAITALTEEMAAMEEPTAAAEEAAAAVVMELEVQGEHMEVTEEPEHHLPRKAE